MSGFESNGPQNFLNDPAPVITWSCFDYKQILRLSWAGEGESIFMSGFAEHGMLNLNNDVELVRIGSIFRKGGDALQVFSDVLFVFRR